MTHPQKYDQIVKENLNRVKGGRKLFKFFFDATHSHSQSRGFTIERMLHRMAYHSS